MKRRNARHGMSGKHCELIRKCPCAGCLLEPAGTIHHLKSLTGERGMGLRSTDKFGVPMCPMCHEDIEAVGTRNERATFLKWGVDPHKMAAELWEATGNLEQMAKIVREHKP